MSSRVDRLLGKLAEEQLDALLVTNLTNVHYLTGFTGTSGLALISPDRQLFLSDFRYEQQATEQVSGFECVTVSGELTVALTQKLPNGELRLGFDDADLSLKAFEGLRERLGEKIELVASSGVVAQLRSVKDRDEIEKIRAATAIADAAYEKVFEDGLVGRTERAIAARLEYEMRLAGAEGVSFPSIVATGAHGALPHAEPRDVEIPANTLVVIDWGAICEGYCSDCTRTTATGEIDGRMGEVYELVHKAQQRALDAIKAGISGRDADAVARETIAAGGFGDHFGHGLGHGVGLEVHEGPRLSQTATGELVADNVVTVEPGIYLPGEFGVRIEDLVVVHDYGCEVLTALPKS